MTRPYCACDAHVMRMRYPAGMGKMLQVRNLPPRVHSELQRRANKAGRTLTDYVQEILEREVARPPREEVFARVRRRQRVALSRRASEYVSEARREVS